MKLPLRISFTRDDSLMTMGRNDNGRSGGILEVIDIMYDVKSNILFPKNKACLSVGI